MNLRLTILGLAVCALAAGVVAFAPSQPDKPAPKPAAQPAAQPAPQPPAKADKDDDEGEETIKLSEAPEAVRAAVAKLAAEKNVTKVERQRDEGITTFEVAYDADGIACSATLTDKGEVIETERSIKPAAVPEAAMKAVMKQYAGATVKSAMAVQVSYYEVVVMVNGKPHEVKVYASGSIEDEFGQKEEAEQKKGEGRK